MNCHHFEKGRKLRILMRGIGRGMFIAFGRGNLFERFLYQYIS